MTKQEIEQAISDLSGILSEIDDLNLDYWEHGAERRCEYQETLKRIKPQIEKLATALKTTSTNDPEIPDAGNAGGSWME